MNMLYKICMCSWVLLLSTLLWLRIYYSSHPEEATKLLVREYNPSSRFALFGLLVIVVFALTIASAFRFIFSL